MSELLDAFLDIETTGLSPDSCDITVIGIYRVNGKQSSLVQLFGETVTADKLINALDGTGVIYTYNGSRFDIPFIHRRLGINLAEMFDHRDLMFTCWQNNLYGGMKSVETQLNIPRRLKDMNGLEAIRLWWQYINDYDDKALACLLEYNKEDVINLKTLRDRLMP